MVNENFTPNSEIVELMINAYLSNFNGLDNKWPILLNKDLKKFESRLRLEKLKDVIGGFRQGIEETPELFPDFFRAYEQKFITYRNDISPESRNKFVLQDIAGLSILSDYDETGYITCEMMFVGSEVFAPCYDYPNNYGAAMKSLSEHFLAEGSDLKNLLFNKTPLN